MGFHVVRTDSYISLCSSVSTSLLTLINFITPSSWGGCVRDGGMACRGLSGTFGKEDMFGRDWMLDSEGRFGCGGIFDSAIRFGTGSMVCNGGRA